MAHPFIPEGASVAVAAASAFLHIFPHDFARYLIGAGGVYLIVNLAFARRLAGRKIRPSSPGGKQMRREFVTSLRTTAVFTMAGVVSVLGAQAGIIQTYYAAAERGWGYFWFSLLALIVLQTRGLLDASDPPSAPLPARSPHPPQIKQPSPWTAYSFDVSEAAINAVFLPLALIVLPTSYIAIFLFLLHMIVRNAIGHCGYELMPSRRNGRPLIGWMTTVTHHDLHHAQAGWNYGLYFTWWDRMMGTEHPLYLEKFAAAVRKPLDGSAVGALGRLAHAAE
ncbi:MAG: sterol desaturase family protein [Parvularculaceae bacterium]